MQNNLQKRTIAEIKSKYEKDVSPWLLAYSGGKDSSAVLKMLLQAMACTANKCRSVYIVFCDTGVENPLVADFIRYTFRQVNSFIKCNNLPASTHILRPEKKNRFWIKVIGRGCPPPTNRFRWCTDKLRVNPLRDFCTKNDLTNATTILGVRKGESRQRDNTIEKYAKSDNYLRYYDSEKRSYYCPIFKYSVVDVWNCLSNGSIFNDNFYKKLAGIYGINDRRGEEVYRTNGHRMGCWVCTVVRKDKSTEDLVKRGFTQLEPYLRFRNWLCVFRDNPKYRCKKRRNGRDGPGPITIQGRKIILSNLLELQNETKTKLITDSEIAFIYNEWEKDCHG
jgi:DNA sulfur modification protein DndC